MTGKDEKDTAALEELGRIFSLQRRAHETEGPPDYNTRMEILDRLLTIIQNRTDEAVAAMDADFGSRSTAEILVAEIYTTASGIRYLQKNLKALMRTRKRASNAVFLPGRSSVIVQPKGVTGVLAPWNYPFYLALLPLATALAAGNRVMCKPSEFTPRTSELMATMISEILPPEGAAVITGGPDVGGAFSRMPFDHLLFTGSTAVGRMVMGAASQNLTPLTLELGGKSPALVCPDYSLQTAAERIAAGKSFNAGQTCVAPDYALVPTTKAEPFAEQVLACWRRFYPTITDNPDYTAIINERHYERLAGYLAQAREKGATVISLKTTKSDRARAMRKLPPSVVLGATPDMDLSREEIFGPILPVYEYQDLNEAIRFINARPRPLALYLFTERRKNREKVLVRTTSGGVTINDTMLHVAQDDLPFGGIGPSGMGAYHAREGFYAFSHCKAVFTQKSPSAVSFMRPPYSYLLDKILRMLIG
ncbi:MAG: coniferyl aldehyde dehydrogenase [Thermodesulfobacteriota bacterium]